jgi:TRAP-type C4-dicarboxylate transport system permease small subunit
MTFTRFLTVLDRLLTTVMITLVILMVVSISSEIVLREVIQAALLRVAGTNPLWLTKLSAPLNTASQTLLVWIGLLGSALAFRHRAHLGVDALVRLYPRRVRVALDLVSTALVTAFSGAVLLYGGWTVCSRALRLDFRMPGFEGLNRAWFYAVLPLTGLLILVYSVHCFLHPKPVEAAGNGEGESEEP